MSFALDPVISNVFFTASLIPKLGRPRKPGGVPALPQEELPPVSVLITFCRETREDVDMTITSLIGQTYPAGKLEVLMAVEPDDYDVHLHVKAAIERMYKAGVASKMIVSDGKLKIKPHALNIALREARGVYCAFYDAADIIDRDQIEKAISLMERGNYDVAQARVLRKGRGFLSRFLYIDTVVWYCKSLPTILRFARGVPLSGEGLFVKHDALKRAGYFKEVLAEDAYLGLVLTEQNRRFALVDSTVVEKAPRGIKSHFRQKVRWHRGYLTCLRQLFRSNLSWRRKFFLLLPFIAPITCCLGFLGWLSIGAHYFILKTLFPAFRLFPLWMWMDHPVYLEYIRLWSFFLVCVGFPLAIISQAHTLVFANERHHVPMTVLFPFYWIFVGFCAMCSFFRQNHIWTKTER